MDNEIRDDIQGVVDDFPNLDRLRYLMNVDMAKWFVAQWQLVAQWQDEPVEDEE